VCVCVCVSLDTLFSSLQARKVEGTMFLTSLALFAKWRQYLPHRVSYLKKMYVKAFCKLPSVDVMVIMNIQFYVVADDNWDPSRGHPNYR
jgi:hypothetical protein